MKHIFEKNLEITKENIYCSNCGKKLSRENISVLIQTKEKTLLHLNCDHCHSFSLVFVYSGKPGVFVFGMATDLSNKEAIKFLTEKNNAISMDQVLEVYQFLKSSKGMMDDFI